MSKGNGPVSLFIVSTYCRFLQRDAAPVPVFAFAGCVRLGKEDMGAAARRQRGAGPVAGRPSGASAPDHITGFRSTTQRGSAGWVQRHAGPVAGRCKNSPETGEFCFVSQPFPWRLAAQAPDQSHRRHSPPPPFAQGRLSLPHCIGSAFSVSLGPYRAPPGGAKRVGEKLSFSPRDSGGVT